MMRSRKGAPLGPPCSLQCLRQESFVPCDCARKSGKEGTVLSSSVLQIYGGAHTHAHCMSILLLRHVLGQELWYLK